MPGETASLLHHVGNAACFLTFLAALFFLIFASIIHPHLLKRWEVQVAATLTRKEIPSNLVPQRWFEEGREYFYITSNHPTLVNHKPMLVEVSKSDPFHWIINCFETAAGTRVIPERRRNLQGLAYVIRETFREEMTAKIHTWGQQQLEALPDFNDLP